MNTAFDSLTHKMQRAALGKTADIVLSHVNKDREKAMVQLVEGCFGIATLPQAAVERLSSRLPLRVLRCEAPLAPLPIHASFREDPSSQLTEAVLDSALGFVSRTIPKHRTAAGG